MLTERQLADKYGITDRTLQSWIKFLRENCNLRRSQGIRGRNEYDDEAVKLLDEFREHMGQGLPKAAFITAIEPEIVTKLPAINRQENNQTNFAQIYQEFSQSDPFYDYEMLQRCADKCWYLPTEKLAIIIDKSPRSFSSLKSFVYQGFVIVRQEQRMGHSYVWSINANS
jgi:hypothetical protein